MTTGTAAMTTDTNTATKLHLRCTTQADAEFHGVEADVSYRFSDAFSATVFADRVRATVEFYRVAKQIDIADFESELPGYNMHDLTVSYQLGDSGNAKVYLRGSTLLDDQVGNHTSFLASVVPLPGRNFTAGLRHDF